MAFVCVLMGVVGTRYTKKRNYFLPVAPIFHMGRKDRRFFRFVYIMAKYFTKGHFSIRKLLFSNLETLFVGEEGRRPKCIVVGLAGVAARASSPF